MCTEDHFSTFLNINTGYFTIFSRICYKQVSAAGVQVYAPPLEHSLTVTIITSVYYSYTILM